MKIIFILLGLPVIGLFLLMYLGSFVNTLQVLIGNYQVHDVLDIPNFFLLSICLVIATTFVVLRKLKLH
jgi:hypothetical protein